MSRPAVAARASGAPLAAALLAAAALAGCASTAPATATGECRVFRAAPHAVRAGTPSGQRWVDTTIETGVRVCGHPRPPAAPRRAGGAG